MTLTVNDVDAKTRFRWSKQFCKFTKKILVFGKKFMADLEVKAAENVIEACALTPSIRHCVLTSSLLACTWKDHSVNTVSPVINHDCWSDESLCTQKKVFLSIFIQHTEQCIINTLNTSYC